MIYRALGVTAISLLFQACYGPPIDVGSDVTISGTVKSKETGDPITGIQVSIRDTDIQLKTSNNGNFYIYVPRQYSYTVDFEDIDGPDKGGEFKPHTITVSTYEGESEFNIPVELEEVDG